ncbi:diguanylate cyclase [Reinekea sp.]|uniref:diguanylate cyclase n=1 Tax=Reinekea sp. TaxID=1970455 RepID=UPI003989AD47
MRIKPLSNYFNVNGSNLILMAITICLSLASMTLASELESVSLKLKWKHQFQFAGYYAAIEKGFYRDAGFDVTLIEHQGDSDLFADVISGDIEFGLSDSSIVVKRLQGQPVVILSTVFQHSPSVLISIKENDILSPFELSGKRVMFQKNADDAAIQAMLISLGIRQADYELIDHTFEDFALVKSNPPIDVMSAYLSNEPYIYQQAGYDVQIIDPANYGIDFYGDLIYSSERYVSKYPERAIAFKEASLLGWRYALDNPSEVINWLQNKYPSGKTIEALNYEADVIRKMIASDFVALGSLYSTRFQRIADIYKQLGLAPVNGNLDGLTLNDYLDIESDKTQQLVKVTGSIAVVLLLLLAILVIVMRSLRNTIKKRTNELNILNKELTHQVSLTDQYVISARLTPNDRFAEVSSALCKVSGYTREELLNINPEALTPENFRNIRQEVIHRVFSGQSEQGDIQQIHKNGTLYWLHLYADPVRDSSGLITGIRFTASDITEKKLIERMSETDTLTGIANRKRLDSVLAQEWSRYQRHTQEVAIILLDLDHFKQINDKFGHSEGDNVLIALADVVTHIVRATDVVGRWGGEEFLIVLPQTSLADAALVAQKLRTAVATIDVLPNSKITASFGVAASSQVTDLEALFRIADKALYRSKTLGRDRIEIADKPDEAPPNTAN